MKSSHNPADVLRDVIIIHWRKIVCGLKGPTFLYLRENPYTEEISINENDDNVYLEKLRGDFPDV